MTKFLRVLVSDSYFRALIRSDVAAADGGGIEYDGAA